RRGANGSRSYEGQQDRSVQAMAADLALPGDCRRARHIAGTMEHLVQPTLDFISAHSGWAFPVMFVTSFGESFAFVSLLFPGTSMLIVAGTLMSAGSLPYWSVLVGAVVGAVLGDSVSFWLGHRYGGG